MNRQLLPTTNELLSRLQKDWIGFDRFASALVDTGTYPPYDIEKIGDDKFLITVAVAGFKMDEINITLTDNILTITGEQTPDEPAEEKIYIHKGIAQRYFTRKFALAEDVLVNTANLVNGMLTIELERIVPEEKKPKTITITSK